MFLPTFHIYGLLPLQIVLNAGLHFDFRAKVILEPRFNLEERSPHS